MALHIKFQSTRPARGATFVVLAFLAVVFLFQSTRPARGATGQISGAEKRYYVSIHAPRAGRDLATGADIPQWQSFNPRAPRGARPSHRG